MPFYSVFVVDFEQVNIIWGCALGLFLRKFSETWAFLYRHFYTTWLKSDSSLIFSFKVSKFYLNVDRRNIKKEGASKQK